ncbi:MULTISPECIES: T9SS type A sorting domain-containing protein [unclassified Saccharicrinis]|uniref:T9SS type A sorting domain-containing protein n=1 Tax=unclassified Saccharicrinis TaxID=2646859 RepID=UPI003D32D858
MLKSLQKTTGALLMSAFSLAGIAQQQITVDVSPTISKSIEGHKDLNRTKYFNLAANVSEIKSKLMGYDMTMADYYINDLEMTVGRKLMMVKSETFWGNSLREDSERPGFTDIDYFKSKKTGLNDDGMDMLKTAFGDNQDLACHEGTDGYPDYMDQYTVDGSAGHKYPSNAESAAELISTILKYGHTDFQRPAYYELMNEPHWKHYDDQRFIDLHVKTKEKVTAEGVNTLIGGPCSSVSNYHKNEYRNLRGITNFISNTEFKLDFYSFHSYDYMKWDDDANDFVGAINSGLPLEGVLDACAAYCSNAGHEFKYLASEHGGYISDSDNRETALEKLGQQYFAGSGFDYEMEKRNIDNFIMVNSAIANTMTYMNHPHVVLKSVPFILLETSGWDPYYYSSLLVKENFDKNSADYRESKLIDFYKLFKGVKGRRVDTYIDDTDIQHHAFVSDNQLIMVFHNQSNTDAEITLNINNYTETPSDYTVRRLRRQVDFRPEMLEESLATLSTLEIGSQESIVVFVNYANTIGEEKTLNESMFYASETGAQFNGSKDFEIDLANYTYVNEAELRVGIGRDADNSKEVKLFFNGTELDAPVEDCAERITGDYYATTKIVKVPADLLKNTNTIRVTFPDGKSGGVGAVVLRARIEDDASVNSIKYNKSSLKIFPNPSNSKVYLTTEKEGVIEVLSMDGVVKKKVQSEKGTTVMSVMDLNNGTYVVRYIVGSDASTGLLSVQ